MLLFILLCGILSCISRINCANNCTNCLYDCDVSESCINSTCKSGYYGNTCIKNLPQPGKPFLRNLTSASGSCVATIGVTVSTGSQLQIGWLTLIYANESSSNPSTNLTIDQGSQINMTVTSNTNVYEVKLPIVSVYNRFAAYFVFEDIDLFGNFKSSISEVYRTAIFAANCSSTDNPNAVIPTSTSSSTSTTSTTTSTISSTRPNSITTTQTPSTAFSSSQTTSSSSIITSTPNQISPTTPGQFTPTILTWSKGYTNGTITWAPPKSSGYTGYKIYRDNAIYNTDGTATSYVISNLNPEMSYRITISAIYTGTINFNSTTLTVYTRPYPLLQKMSAPVIYNITDSSLQVTFPSYDNYNGTKNLYYIAIQKTSLSRRKRATSNCQLPSSISIGNAAVVYTNSFNSSPIAVGFGNVNGSDCQNDKLTPNTNYTVFAIIGSTYGGDTEYTMSSSVIQTNSSGLSGGAIAAIVIGILLLLILIILLLWFFIFRKKKEKIILYNSSNIDEKPSSHMFWSSIVDRMEPRKIILDEKNHCEGLNFKDEYENLPSPDCDEKCHGGTHNLGYSVDYSGDTYSYGVNECHIDGYSKKNAFISSYFPIGDQSINDFWFMVYKNNIGQIVMLSEVGSMMKDCSHFPEKTEVYGYIEVFLVKERHYADFDIRIFDIKKIDTNEKIKVTQYHYRSWPSNDTFCNHVSFLEFHEIVKKQESIIFGPTLVQCKQGSNLNTLYIGFDILIDRLNQEDEVNVYEEFGHLRKYRHMSMININQYMLVYDFLFEAFLCSRFAVSFDMNEIEKKNELESFIEQQYDYLMSTHQRICLNKIRKNDYEFYDSIEFSRSIMLSPSPKSFHEAFINLWDTVFKYEVSVIVDLVNANISEIIFTSHEISKYKISIKDTRNCSNNVTIQVISVIDVYTNQKKSITLYSTQSAHTSNYTKDECASWVELIYSMITNLDYNILIFKDEESVLSSFVFLACFNAAVKLKRTRFVSVYYIVKSLLISGQSSIIKLEQYRFIFYFLQMLIDRKMNNENGISDRFNSMNMHDTFKWGPYKHLYHSSSNVSPKRSQKGHKKSPNYRYPN